MCLRIHGTRTTFRTGWYPISPANLLLELQAWASAGCGQRVQCVTCFCATFVPAERRAKPALPAAQELTSHQLRPYLGYNRVLIFLSGSTSNYNALQAHATKRKGDFMASVSCKFSKARTDASVLGAHGDPVDGLDKASRTSRTGLPFQKRLQLSSEVNVRLSIRSMYNVPRR